jgi:hypothetical protein
MWMIKKKKLNMDSQNFNLEEDINNQRRRKIKKIMK